VIKTSVNIELQVFQFLVNLSLNVLKINIGYIGMLILIVLSKMVTCQLLTRMKKASIHVSLEFLILMIRI